MSEPFPLSKPFTMAPTRLLARPLLRSALLIVPFLVLASYGLFDERLLGYHHYRQSHDALLARTFAAAGVSVADVAGAFSTAEHVCAWTWFCTHFDTHPNATGYGVIADAFLDVIQP